MATLTLPIQNLRKQLPRKVIVFLIHFVCLTILFLLPEVLLSVTTSEATHESGLYVKAAVWVAVFYASFFLTPNPATGRRDDIWRFCIGNILILFLAIILLQFIWIYYHQANPGPPHPPGSYRHGPFHEDSRGFLLIPMLRDAVMVILTIALSLAIKLIDKFQEVERLRRETAEREREAELHQLKAQLNPHFLFNTLNSIYVLVDIAPSKAQKAIHQLSRMLRYMLYENQGTVKLGDEIEFMRHYIELMQLRLGSDTSLRLQLPSTPCELLPISPLLFVNIIENAFKYGMRASDQGPIDIRLTCSNSIITLYTANNYDARPDSESTGIGLTNLRRRLAIQYSGRHSLEVSAGKRFEVTLSIDLSKPPDFIGTSKLQTDKKILKQD